MTRDKEMMLVHQAKNGSAAAFSELYEIIYRDLYRFAYYTLKNGSDAEDTVSDTVTDAWAQIGTLRKEESFRGWIFRILSNKCRQKLKAYLDKTEELPEDLCSPEEDTGQNVDVRNAFAKLEEEERMIISLNLFGGYSSREIGEMLSMTDNTVRSRQTRGLAKMADYLRG